MAYQDIVSETIRTAAWMITIMFCVFAGTIYGLAVLFVTGRPMFSKKKVDPPMGFRRAAGEE